MNENDLSNLILRKILAVNTVNRAPGVYVNRNRSIYAIGIKIEGKTTYDDGYSTVVADANHLVLYRPGAKYSYALEKGKCVMIEFEGEEETNPMRLSGFALGEAAAQDVIKTALSMADLWDMKKPNYTLKCKSLFYRILYKAASTTESQYVSKKTRDVLLPALEYMHKNYSDVSISNDSLAALCGVSTVYFRKLFTAAYGIPPMRYLKNVRINKAKELLIGDADSISAISENTGFGSVYAFSKAFKAETGVSPSGYVK